MEIQIAPHTLKRAEERGTDQEEIRDVIESGETILARHGRLGRAKVYSFEQERQGRYYAQKRVEVIYTIEDDTVVTVTVYVFYGKWEDTDADNV